jgi:hypothetical protein
MFRIKLLKRRVIPSFEETQEIQRGKRKILLSSDHPGPGVPPQNTQSDLPRLETREHSHWGRWLHQTNRLRTLEKLPTPNYFTSQ